MVTPRSLIRRGLCLLAATPSATVARVLRADWKRTPDIALIAVYRHRNGENLRRLIQVEGLHEGQVALWALDTAHADLSKYTVGEGPGGRFLLLQACIDALKPTPETWVVLADDDVTVPRKGLQAAVALAKDMGLDMAQPAHSWNSFYTYPFTLGKAFTIGRVTDFVEIGPVLVVGPKGRQFLGSLRGASPMGWGVDVDWAAVSRQGRVRLGIIDLVMIRHLTRPGTHYERDAENAALKSSLTNSGAGRIQDLQRTRRRRWFWQSVQ
jgi:hypothetical protein